MVDEFGTIRCRKRQTNAVEKFSEAESVVKQMASDLREFFKQIRQEFTTTGAVAPSGRFLAKAITKPMGELHGPRRICEIGPGTGAFTKRIVRELRDGDVFDLVEINSSFASHLRGRFETCPDYKRVSDRCEVHCIPLQDFEPNEKYDCVISGLPLNNFSPELVTELVDAAIQLVRPGGTFSMFEYMFVRPIRSRIGPKKTRDRMKAIEEIMQSRFQQHRYKTDWIFPNVLPAWVQHMRIDDPDREVAASADSFGKIVESSNESAGESNMDASGSYATQST